MQGQAYGVGSTQAGRDNVKQTALLDIAESNRKQVIEIMDRLTRLEGKLRPAQLDPHQVENPTGPHAVSIHVLLTGTQNALGELSRIVGRIEEAIGE